MACDKEVWRRDNGNCFAKFKPFPDSIITKIDASFYNDMFDGPWLRRVSWPSIGSVTPEKARAFAAAIIEAADWCDKQGGK